jgi:hypothetical protein
LRCQITNLSAAAVGVLLMLLALANSFVTLANGHYGGVLLTSGVSATLALVCFAIPLVRGPLRWRIIAVVLALPWLFVISDFVRRAPYAFGGG